MAKKSFACENCGATFEEKYKLYLHYDFHRGEPVVRPIACPICLDDLDIRRGSCTSCGYVYSTGWIVRDGVAVSEVIKASVPEKTINDIKREMEEAL